ncbi:MAG: YihY/virulence factor BrkB family protein [Chloroflexi bacterium]|nr:YihY/virulence factor BrkB family protein [Chloroflexota bacterium]
MSVETIARTLARWLVRLPASVVHWLLVLWGASVNFGVGRVYLMAAAISYFALLSIFPFLLLALAIFGVVLRDEELQGRVLAEIVAALPIEAPTIAEALNNLAGRGASMGLFALIGTVIAATALARALRGSLNAIFRAEQQRPIVVGWLLDLTVLPVLGLLFITSLLLSTVWRFVEALAGNIGPLEELTLFWELGAFAIPALLSFVGLLLLYLFLPNRPLHLRDVWPGALIAMLGFQIGTFVFAIYFENFGAYDLVYGSLGGVIALLGWVFVSSLILLFGAEVAAEASRRANDR